LTIAWHVVCLEDVEPTAPVRAVKRIDIMDTFAPETSRSVEDDAAANVEAKRKRDDESRAQQAALEQLADRISAARSVL
jgi:hypothetical protein